MEDAGHGHRRKPKKAPCSIRPLGLSSVVRDKSSSELLSLYPLVLTKRVRARMGSGRRSYCTALVAVQLSLGGRSPLVLQYSGTSREAQAALGSCLICLCLKPAQLDALSSDAVRRRENKRHSCRVRGSAGSRAVTQCRMSCPADRYWLQQRGYKPKIAPSRTHEINRWEGVRAPKSPRPVLCCAVPRQRSSASERGVHPPAPQEWGGCGVTGAKVPYLA